MIEVRVRHVNDTTSVHLADVPFENLDEVIPAIQRWGGFSLGLSGAVAEQMTGQLVYDPDNAPTTAYFEVVIDGS